jgi:hypothetical protein
MRALFHTGFRRVVLLLAALTLLLTAAAGAFADNVRTEGVEGMLPYYARLEASTIYHDDSWAVVVFYRPTSYVPADFNLLGFWDFNLLTNPVPATVDGFVLWEELGVQPALINLHGLGAVPVWFVSWDDMQAAVADGMLTIGELGALPTLKKGAATNYQEMLQPDSPDRLGTIEYNAKGKLENGETFQVHVLWTGTNPMRINITFK